MGADYAMAVERTATGYLWTIRQVMLAPDGTIHPAPHPVAPSGATWWALAECLAAMVSAEGQPVLDLTSGAPRLVNRNSLPSEAVRTLPNWVERKERK